MRPASSRQLDAVAARDRKISFRVWVNDAGGTPVDWSDFVQSFQVQEDQDQAVVTASVTFWREDNGVTTAPFMSDPAPIFPGRAIEIQVAVVQAGDSVLTEDWEPIFRGTIDDTGWGGQGAEVTVPARGKGRNLIKSFIRTEQNYGNIPGTEPVQNVIQAILDDVFGVGGVELDVVGDPDLGILEYTQKRESVQSAIQALVDLNGWVARYVWNEAYQDWRLTLYEPDRAKTTPDHVFGPADYLEVTELDLSTADIRNEVEVLYSDEVNSVVVVDSDSIAEFGGPNDDADYFFLDVREDPQINTLAKATALAVAILSDLSQPRAVQVTKNAFFPFVELGDLYRFTANDVHYNTDQDMAVTGYSHSVSRDGAFTTLRVRGTPSGGASRWFRRRTVAERKREIIDTDEPTEELATEDIKFLYTNRYASQGFDVPSSQSASLGGWISTSEVIQGLNGVFRDVDDTERVNGITLYRAIAAVNFNAAPVPKAWECVIGWLPAEDSDGVNWAVALDPTGVVPYDDVYQQAYDAPDEETEPTASPALVWVAPTSSDHPDVLDVGDVPAGQGFVFWIRLTVDPGAAGQVTDEFLTFQDRVPAT